MLKKKIKILHVVGVLDSCGGIQQGLRLILDQAIAICPEIEMDFFINNRFVCDVESEIRSRGAKIFSADFFNFYSFFIGLRRVVKRFGPYDIVHAHIGFRNGFCSLCCRLLGVNNVVVHSHSSFDRSNEDVFRKIYNCFMGLLMRRFATSGLAVSDKAFEAMFSGNPNAKWRIMPFVAFDKNKFLAHSTGVTRKEFGICNEALVLGFVGRFSQEKNLEYLLQIARVVSEKRHNTVLVLVGAGSKLDEIKKMAKCMSLDTRFLGLRDDVPTIMMELFDAFLLPSVYEGMPITLIEAQAAGLPCFISSSITNFGVVIPELVYKLNISYLPEVWADTILKAVVSNNIDKRDALELVEQSPFSVNNSSRELFDYYFNLLSREGGD